MGSFPSIQQLTFTLKHGAGTHNEVGDALSWKVVLLSTLQVQVGWFCHFEKMNTFRGCEESLWVGFQIPSSLMI